MTQLRLEILPLEIETGRPTPIYGKSLKKNIKRSPSKQIFDLNRDEVHFISLCSKYNEIRHTWSE